MRYGRVTPEQVARMARRADAGGQLGLACLLYAIAGAIREDDPLGSPMTVFSPADRDIERGLAIDHKGDGRRTKEVEAPS